MKKPSEKEDFNSLRNKIIGLGEKSLRKSYYPELQKRIFELEEANKQLKSEIEKREVMAAEQKKLVEQLHQAQKLESLGTLAGGIAHDFNNMLTPILGYAELIAATVNEDCPAMDDIQHIIQAANRAKDLVKQILDYSRPAREAISEINIKSLIFEAMGLFRASLPTSIKIEHNLQESSPILAEPTKIHQVIMNLCTNARHAMQRKGGILKIVSRSVKMEEEDARFCAEGMPAGEYVKIEISDTGGGMEPHIREKIFDPFFTTRQPGEGTGLGLSVVHSIVQSHGGFINCYSEPGQGTVFSLYFPTVNVEGGGSQVSGDLEIERGSESVLVVDDEPSVCGLLEKTLSELGYKVTATTSSTKALQQFIENPENFRLLVSDATMPELSGIELIYRIREIKPDLPVILCSGFSDMINEEKVSQLRISRYLMKPIIRNDLAKAVRQAIDSNISNSHPHTHLNKTSEDKNS